MAKLAGLRITRRSMVLTTMTAGLGVAASVLWWNRTRAHRLFPGSIVIEGPFEEGVFNVSQLNVDGLTEKCPVEFSVGFEEDHGCCTVWCTFAPKGDRLPSHDVSIMCAVIGGDGEVLERRGSSPAICSRPRPTVSNALGGVSLGYRGYEALLELRSVVALRDIKRLEIVVS